MLKVVVVDDYPLEGQAVQFLLQKNRPEIQYVGQALSGEAGLELILQSDPDVAFVDIKMPGMNGLALTEQIKSHAPNTKVVIVTAFDDFSFIQSALRLGTHDYLLKPMKPEELYRIVDKLDAERRETIQSTRDAPVSQNGILTGLCEQLLIEMQKGNADASRQAFTYFWEHLLLDAKKNPAHIRINIKALANATQQSVEYQECALGDTRKEVIEYACKTLISDLPAMDDLSAIEANTRTFVENCANVYNENLYECGYHQIIRAKELIEENLHQNITLESIAQSIFISPFYLSRLFKKRTGTNFIDYVILRKIERAKTLLLTTNTTIESVSAAVGYDEPNSFRRLFKKRVGMSPNEYRQISRQDVSPSSKA